MANVIENQDGACTLDVPSELPPHVSRPSTTSPWGEMGDTAEISQEFYARIQAAESWRYIGLWVLKFPVCASGNLGLNILFWSHDRQSILKCLCKASVSFTHCLDEYRGVTLGVFCLCLSVAKVTQTTLVTSSWKCSFTPCSLTMNFPNLCTFFSVSITSSNSYW